MGYRLSIEEMDGQGIFYGSKYYGYVGDDVDEMLKFGSKSCKYLYNKKCVDEYTFWAYGADNIIKLKQNETLRFIKLYIKDLIDNQYPINCEIIDELFETYKYIKQNKNNYFIRWC